MNEGNEGQASLLLSKTDLFLSVLKSWRQAAPGHPQTFLFAIAQHHPGFIHVDEQGCLVTSGPSRFGPLQVRSCLTAS